jgi:hypothetical protein
MKVTHLAHLLVALDERVHNLDCQEIVIDWRLCVRKENVGRDDSGQIMCVHLRSRLLIDLMEGCDPVEERTENL